MILFLLFAQFFTPAPLAQRGPETVAEGSWVSCPIEGGDYGERALDYKSSGHPWFEIHYGPRDEFAIFAGNTDTHIDHDDARNLLRPAYRYGDVYTRAGGRNWSIASLGITLNVVALPPSQEDCYSFVTKLSRDKRPTWANR